ncbi:MAG: hypothetical protein EXS42_05870 [Lacunisphaera sp.]|nr:hypothetical protein [Lacunisphaera sp.]
MNSPRLLLLGFVLFSALLAKDIKPGVERWSIKTSVPAGTDMAHGKTVPFADLIALPDPVPHPKMNDHLYAHDRYPAFANKLGVKEGDILTVRGWLHIVARENDGDYHFQISASKESGDDCLIVEVPIDDPAFVRSAELRKAVADVRAFLKKNALNGKKPSEGSTIVKKPILVDVTGQLFYDDAHVTHPGGPRRGKHGQKAATLWELHPVTAIRLAESRAD